MSCSAERVRRHRERQRARIVRVVVELGPNDVARLVRAGLLAEGRTGAADLAAAMLKLLPAPIGPVQSTAMPAEARDPLAAIFGAATARALRGNG